jgi:hypothetical protein
LSPTTSVNPVQTSHTVTATTNGPRAGVPIWFSVITSSNCQGGTNAGEACFNNAACDLGSGVCTSNLCVGGTNNGFACVLNSFCDPGSGVCNPTGGGNVGATFNPNPCFTSGNPGSCSSYYIGGTTSTIDTIRACGDFSTDTQGVSDDLSYADCALDNDGNSEDDALSNTVFKTWLENFWTGGGGIGKTQRKPPTHTFGGNGGPNPVASPDCKIEWQVNDHGVLPVVGTKEACHFNSCAYNYCAGTGANAGGDCVSSNPDCPNVTLDGFDTCVVLTPFSGPCTTSPPSNNNTATAYIRGTCNNGDTVEGILTVVDRCEGNPTCSTTPDQIQFDCIPANSSAGACANLAFPAGLRSLTNGNLQVHQTPTGTCP